jgi:hypothetical protein
MKKEFILSKIEAVHDGSPYVYVGFVDPTLLTKEDIKNSLDKSGYKFVRLGNRGF